MCLLYAAIAAAAPAGPHCSRGAEGREGGEVDACLCLCGWLCTVVNRCEHNDCQTRQLHKQCQCCPRSSKNKAATCMRAMVHLDVCSFPSFGAHASQQQQQQHLAPVLSLELLGTGATAASGSSHPPPPMAGMRPTLSIDDRRSLLCENDFVLLLVPCHHLTQHPPSISPRAGRKRQWTAQAARGGEGRRQGRPRRGHDVVRVDETDAGGAAALGGRPR